MTVKRGIWIVGIAAVIALLAWSKLSKSGKEESAGKQTGKKMPVKVSVYPAREKSATEILKVSGNLLAMEEVELVSETQGRVTRINFEEGSEVKAGQLLVKINDAELKAQLKKAHATRLLKDETETRSRQLLAKGAISQEEYDLALSERSAINADIDLLNEQIRKTEITAPFDGLIGLRYISPGSYVTSNSKIASLHNINRIKVEFSVPEKYATRISKNDEVSFQTEGRPDVFRARIYAIEPKVDAATRNVVMRAICDNDERKLLPGAYASISVGIGSSGQVLLIPTQAVVPVLKGKKVFLMQGDSAVERMIATGSRGDSLIEVKEGLSTGDPVIVNGVMYVRQGSKVKL